MTRSNRVLLIGIDAAERSLLFDWARQGLLPNFNSILERGAWGTTRSPPGLYVGAVWPSFHTALSPTRHMRYCYDQLRPGTYEDYRVEAEHVVGEPFWETLSRQAKRVAVIDVPKARLARELNGIQVADWGTHDPEHDVVRTFPEPLAASIVRDYGRDPVGICNGARKTTADFRSFRDALLDRIRTKTALVLDFLKREEWDCFLAVFADSHCVGHQCWHLHDPAHPRHDRDVVAALGDPMMDVYRALDTAVGRILAAAGDETTSIVLASHGMGPHYEATFMLDRILDAIEPKGTPKGRPTTAKALARVWATLPTGLRNVLRPYSHRAKSLVDPVTMRRSSRRSFKVPNNDVFGGIRVNLRGREPAGTVDPGDFDAYCAFLREALMSFENLESGQPLVSKVWSVREMYPGEDTAGLPDLLVEWNRNFPISRVTSPKTGPIEAAYAGCRTGDHREQGVFAIVGPGIKPLGQIAQASVTDFGPTIAELVGAALPGVDGRSIVPILRGN
jgi:predicted AlkP superfamily phosphohydrolase/phosphomutase